MTRIDDVYAKKNISYLFLKNIKNFIYKIKTHISNIISGSFYFINNYILGKKSPRTYHVIGDSHTLVFKSEIMFKVHHIGPATAFNIIKKNNTTQSYEKIISVISTIDKLEDAIIIALGEIDCRIHIYNKYMKYNNNESISDLIDKTILNYGILLNQIKRSGFDFYVYGVPPAGFQDNIYNYPYYADPVTRCNIYKEFNTKLKYYCSINDFKYIDIYSLTSDKNGFISRKYASDEVHLNKKVIPLVKFYLINH